MGGKGIQMASKKERGRRRRGSFPSAGEGEMVMWDALWTRTEAIYMLELRKENEMNISQVLGRYK